MKKAFYIIVLGLLGFVGFTRANVNSMNATPVVQSAISGSLVTFTVTGTNATGDAYLKYVLPKTVAYDVLYQNASLTPLNNALLSLGSEHDPVFYIPANSNFSVTITAKLITNVRTIPTINTTANVGADMQVSPVLTSAIAQITPISDLIVTNVLTGMNPSFSGDNVSYYITLQNIGSTAATGITFTSTFPIPTLYAPTATFNGTPQTYSYVNYPQDFVRTGNYLSNLNAGQTMTILLNAPMTQNFAVGTTFNQIAKTTTASAEYSATNNSATATGIVQSAADVRVTKTMAPFTGFNAGEQVFYTITYGNSGGKSADNAVITDIVPAGINIPVSTFTIGTLPAGSGGIIVLTGTLASLLNSGYVFVNTANITTASVEGATGNNSATVTGTIQGLTNINVGISANNLTRPQLDNVPYGSGSAVLIQAVSGDLVQINITYTNYGNTVGTHAILGLLGTQGFVSLSTFNGTINIIPTNSATTITLTGIVGPRNYISFTPTARLTHDIGEVATDSVTIQEPLVCGDGMLTRNEPCDTQGNLGVLYSGQVCENQQGVCVLVTQSIINYACINYQYNNPLGGIITGQACDDGNATLMNSSCNSMTGSSPTTTTSGYDINYTCKASNATSTTPISIDCGNGTSVVGIGTSFNGTCSYASSFVGNAQCRVGNDINNSACRLPASANAGQCDSLDALDGTIAIVDDNGDASSSFRCETVNGTTAQTITIDCGDGHTHTANNVSIYEAACEYNNVNTPQTYNVRCLVDGVSAPASCQENLIVDEGTFGRCGDGIRQGYEDCDDGDLNGTSSSSCTEGCDLKDAGLVGCFNIGNANLSVQENELLPFRRTVDGEKNAVSTCNESNKNKVRANSLECDFKIYNSEGEADDITVPCKNSNNSAIFDYFNSIGASSFTHAYGKYTTTIDSSVIDGIYGEYKIDLEEVQYDYCDGTDFVSGAPLQRVCQTNFTVTKPYLAQKSSFGLTPKATNVPLEGYTMLDGTKLIDSTDLADIMILDESDYNASNQVQAMINTFITKYDKLAITVDNQYLPASLKDLGITVKVIPNQKIYILQSDTKKTITMKNITSFSAPFTIVTKNIDVVIKGNVDYNGMFLVKGGTITFEKSDEVVGGDRCPSTQTVKGIFITDGGFVGGEKLSNMADNKEQCTYGGLYVKGILIGNNIENIVEAKRSQLNHRFKVGGTSDAAIKAERRNEIFNGAAVLIEYSPNLWSALPPGASEFTTALDIYKQ